MAHENELVIADDNPDILRLLSKRLAKRGWTVRTASNGQQALDLVKERAPAAVVLDWMMPVIAGSDVCEELKTSPATAHIPVIMLTARAAEDDIATGFRGGADEYLTKPFDVAELDAALRRLTGRV